MVMHPSSSRRAVRRGSLITEMIIGMAFLIVAILPLGFSFAREHKLMRASYLRTVAMEAVDGEMEILAAGEWRAYQDGQQPYQPPRRTTNLPEGNFSLTLNGKQLRLEWRAAERGHGGNVIREVTLK